MSKRNMFYGAGATVALMIGATLLSKALGILRQMLTAGIFAASPEGVAFSAASGIPLAIFDMLFSTAVLGSFLPIYKGRLDADESRARAFASSFLSVVLAATAVTALTGVALARPIIGLAAPDLDEETARLAAELLRIMFPSMVFAGAAYILIGIFQSNERFFLPALVSALSNLVMILYLLFCPRPVGRASAIGLSCAYLLSWTVQFLTLAVPLWKRKAFPGLTRHPFDSDTVLALRRSLPVMFGSWLIPMTTLIAKAFASFVDARDIAPEASAGAAIVVYENAFSVFSISAGLLAYGVCNYIFPKLSGCFAKGDRASFCCLVERGFLASLAMILPISGAVGLLSDEIVDLLYRRGDFSEALAAAAAESLRILAIAMPAYGMTEFFSRVCYSCGKVRYPMWAGFAGILVSLTAGGGYLILERLSVRTLSLSVVLGQGAAGLLLFFLCVRIFFEKGVRGEARKYAPLLLGFAVSFCTMRVCRDFLRKIFHFSRAFQNFLVMAIVFATGFMVYLIWLIVFKTIRIPDFRRNRESKHLNV